MSNLSQEEKDFIISRISLSNVVGLVWEENQEKAERILETHRPIIQKVEEHSIINNTNTEVYPDHLLIEGENLHALMVLQETHEKKIDLIYIDPPYNRGCNDFVYNDNYQEKDNMYRHSAWLSFMSKRLRIAYTLLHEEGFIFVSIDNNELAQLKLLLDEIFGEQNCIEIFSWMKTKTPSNLSQKTKEMLEYVLCYQKKENKIRFRGVQKTSTSDNPLLKPNSIEKELHFAPGTLSLTCKPTHVLKGVYGTKTNRVELLGDLEIEEGTNKKDISFRGRFVWTQRKLEEELKRGTRISIKTKSMILSYEKTSYAPEVPPNLIDSSVGVGTYEMAKTELRSMDLMGFDYPKPTTLIQYLLRFIPKKEFTFLDFFAGSGTSAHAAIVLNQEEGYSISSIMCTNNQNNIAQDITYRRMERLLKGYTSNNGKHIPAHKANNVHHYQCVLIKR
jgi:adenine-specific DNA-methyltransferase